MPDDPVCPEEPAALEFAHASTCLPDYWGGHHLPHIQLSIWNGMTVKDLKEAAINELHNGCVMGSEAPADNDDAWFKRAEEAVKNVNIAIAAKEGQDPDDVELFTDIELEAEDSDGNDCVYAYFVFREVE